jgi:hypothetical protein
MQRVALFVLLACTACGAATPGPTTSSSGSPAIGGTVVIVGIRGGPPGSLASASVTGPPQTRCTIAVTAPDGHPINAAGLDPRTTDAHGHATWTWQIPTLTATGIGMVDIACGGVHAAPVRLFIG